MARSAGMTRHLPLVLIAACTALLAPAADAAVLPGMPLDGPSAAIKGFGDADVAPDGSGGIAYVKTDGGKDHIYVVRFSGGQFGTPERVDTDPLIAGKASKGPRIAASNGGRLVVTFINGDGMAGNGAWSAVAPAAGQPFVDVSLDQNPAHGTIDVDASGGIAYAVLESGNGDVYSYRLSGTTWTGVATGFPGGRLDNAAGDEAGGTMTQDQPRVAVTADGNAVATWPEITGGKKFVYARRITGTTLGPIAKASIDTLDGAATANFALMVDVDVDGSGAAWVVFREDFVYGAQNKPRILARKLTGDTFGDAQVLDGLPTPPPEGAEFPRVDVNSAGQGLLATPRQLTFQSYASSLTAGTWMPGFRVDTTASTGATGAVAALGESGGGLIAWRQDPGGGGAAKIAARRYDGGALAPEIEVSNPALGTAVAPIEAAADMDGNVLLGFAQGAAGNLAIVGAVVGAPPKPGGGGGGTGGGGTGGGGGGMPADTIVPLASKLKLSPTTFKVGTAQPSLSAARAKAKTGTTISFNLSEPATVRFTVERATAGRKVAGTCVKPSKKNRKAKRCTIYRRVGTFPLMAPGGASRVRFEGRIGKTKLAPGSYRIALVATDPAGNRSKVVQKRFKVVRR